MKSYALDKPCSQCPFTRADTAVRLSPHRAKELAANSLSPEGRGFACHHTVVSLGGKGCQRECAGSLILALKHDNYTQSMRLAMRLGLLTRELETVLRRSDDVVFDSAEEMIASAWRR